MQLYIAEHIHKIRTTPEYFFRAAHQWKFGRDIDPSRDILEYNVAGIVPAYVREYVSDIQQKENQHGEAR